jgi:hypothetical protein
MTTSANLPAARPAISIAGFKNVYHVPRVEEALSGLQELGPGASDALKSTYVKMIKAGGQRFSIKPSALPDIDALIDELPNFEAPLEDIRRQLALCLSSDDPLDLEPMLLLGDPGIGKTHFARRLARLLGTGYSFIGMSSLTAGWILSGASPAQHFGLDIMRDRARLLGGSVDIGRRSDGGTRVSLRVPARVSIATQRATASEATSRESV